MLIALGHEAQQGKDTFAMFVTNHLRKQQFKKLRIVREGFADRLYDLCYSLYKWAGFQTRQFYQDNPSQKEVVIPKLGKTPRDILIDYGMHIREYDPGAWLNAVVKDTDGIHLKIIPDLRLENEFEHCEINNVYRIKIVDPRKPRSTRRADINLSNVPDERWSEIILNDGSLQCFNEKAVEFSERIVIPRLMKYMHGEMRP